MRLRLLALAALAPLAARLQGSAAYLLDGDVGNRALRDEAEPWLRAFEVGARALGVVAELTRSGRLESDGRNAFAEYFVAEAAISLKQGAGRLIRSETDRGLLVVCDPRMATMSYGRRLFAALPPMARLERESEAIKKRLLS